MELPQLAPGTKPDDWIRRFTAWMQTYFLRRVATRDYVEQRFAQLEKRVKTLEGS